RTTVDLASQPLSAGINVACLDRCRVFVNEAPLTESPVDHEGRVRFWEISRFLTSGTNVVAIEAEIIGTRPSLAGLLVQLTLDVAGEPRTGWTSRNFSDDDWSYATVLSSYTRANKPAWKGLVWEREMVRAHQRVWTPFIVEQTYRDEKSSESFPFVSAPVKSRTEIAEIITPTRAATTARSTTPTRPSTSPTRPTRPSTSPTVPR
ncbi:MAG TPA: hypothetical protein PKC45_16055, partial [Gemmatales bacterium]|nr:hypothetical protein [Gemmatales bacterium]